MARVILLDQAITERTGVLFDACVLSDGFRQRDGSGPLRDKIARVPQNRRLTTELVAWEFLQQGRMERNERAQRRQWLNDNRFTILYPSGGYEKTFAPLLAQKDPRGGAVDAALSARAIADGLAIATANGRDFCWLPSVRVILEFLSSAGCPA